MILLCHLIPVRRKAWFAVRVPSGQTPWEMALWVFHRSGKGADIRRRLGHTSGRPAFVPSEQ